MGDQAQRRMMKGVDDLDFYIGDEAVDKPTYSTKVRGQRSGVRFEQNLRGSRHRQSAENRPEPSGRFDLFIHTWRPTRAAKLLYTLPNWTGSAVCGPCTL